MSQPSESSMGDAETAVRERYSAASATVEPELCCGIEAAAEFLAKIPQEIRERDYGCGDSSAFARPGDTVLDLGSGAGKMCYVLAQVVGEQGRVIGVDCNPDMLALSRGSLETMHTRLGFANVEFRNGMIQDLRLDLDRLGEELARTPVRSPADWLALRSIEDRLRTQHPLIEDESVDCVVSSCVLNLVRTQDREQLFRELFRVLKRDGRVAISDIVSDEDVPVALQHDPNLWSGCISGAFREDRFLEAFAEAGFHGIEIVRRQRDAWRTVNGIEFRPVTVTAYKGKQGPCLERLQAVVYRGPFKKVEDDDGHLFPRGERVAVCDKTFRLLQRAPYEGGFDAIEPRLEIPLERAAPFDCRRSKRRDPRETKGEDYQATLTSDQPCCLPGDGCC